MHPQLQKLAARLNDAGLYPQPTQLLTYRTTLSRCTRRDGRELSADFEVRVGVYQSEGRIFAVMTACRDQVYFDGEDNPTSAWACRIGEQFEPADDEERERLDEELAQMYAAWKARLPEAIDFPVRAQSPALPTLVRRQPIASAYRRAGTDRYGIEPAPEDDFDQRVPVPLEDAA